MRPLLLLLLVALFPAASQSANRKTKFPNSARSQAVPATPSQTTASAIVSGQNAGATPFNAQIQIVVTPADSLKSLRFTITPKPGSVTRPVSALYTSEYMQARGYINTSTGAGSIPVFGLYSGYTNTVTLNFTFADGSTQQEVVTVNTAVFTETCGYTIPTIVQARTNSTVLSYDFILMKSFCDNSTTGPYIVDTDSQIRWLGTAPIGGYGYIFFEQSLFMGSAPTSGTGNMRRTTGVTRLEFDATFAPVHDFAPIGVTWSAHHNYDYGKQGMLIEVDTTTQQESVILEIDACGNVLKRWDLADILRNVITLGGEDPSTFVRDAHSPPIGADDWFHNNCAVYWKSDNSLVVSSRENFVICLDYDTGAIKWILGDPTKHWHDFQTLRNFELTVTAGGVPPIGEHALSITYDNKLLLFDNGSKSLHQTPAGASRSFAAPRKYQIDPVAKTATEIWNYLANPAIASGFCSSVYEDAPDNYLIDYAIPGEFIGLEPGPTKVFHYKYKVDCNMYWNSIPFHMENMYFGSPDPATDQRGWNFKDFYRQGNKALLNFRVMAGKTYRVEYKDSLTDPDWHMLSDTTPTCTSPITIADGSPPAFRIYRVRQL